MDEKPHQRRWRPRSMSEPSPWTFYTPVITWTVIVAYTALALGMIVQPGRFADTPSYANLLNVAPAQLWGAGYAAVAGLLLAWRTAAWRCWHRHRGIGVVAHTAAVLLTLWWLGAFVVRYATDTGTTIVNIVSWSVLLSLVIRSTSALDEVQPR